MLLNKVSQGRGREGCTLVVCGVCEGMEGKG